MRIMAVFSGTFGEAGATSLALRLDRAQTASAGRDARGRISLRPEGVANRPPCTDQGRQSKVALRSPTAADREPRGPSVQYPNRATTVYLPAGAA
jgi:hypothetical protein